MKFDIVTFMENAARWCTLIGHTDTEKHFYRISGIQALEEVLQNLGDGFSPALLVEDELEGQLVDNTSDNVLDARSFMFYVAKPVATQDMSDREDVIRDCHLIVRQILALMFKYRMADRKTGNNQYGLRNLDRSSISYFTIGPIGDNCFGMACGFQITDQPDIKFDEELWSFPPVVEE